MRDRLAAGGSLDPGPVLTRGELRLFADLENCTVANDTGITGQSRKALPMETPSGVSEITVKIVRAHGGCLGTKSR